jgi:hypothetical protein
MIKSLADNSLPQTMADLGFLLYEQAKMWAAGTKFPPLSGRRCCSESA